MTKSNILRRVDVLVLCATILLFSTPTFAAGATVEKTTHVYKTVGETKIEADVYRSDDGRVRPVVVWIHGGALIVGSRSSVPRNLLDLCQTEGYALVSLDYRLAPEVKLPAIAEDIDDAFRWLREHGPRLLKIDPDRMVVAGGSAGGYLTMLAGVRVKPRPRALVAYWGYGDVNAAWYTAPSDFYRKQVPLVTKEEAYQVVGGRVLTGTDGNVPAQKNRIRFYHYLRQNGLWTKAVSGFDPVSESRRIEPFCPVRNLPPDYPPILMVHGTTDDDVPYEQSAAMAVELARLKLPHELVTVRGAGHGLAGGDKKLVEEAHARALAFIRGRLSEPSPSRPLVIAHRGLLKHAPENTLSNFRACLALRTGFEFDVRRSQDGHLVCVHDDTVDRTTNGKGRVTDLTLAELQALDAGSSFDPAFRGERIPAVDEIFALVAEHRTRSFLIAVDLKGDDLTIESDVVRLANKHGVLDRLLFIGRAIETPEVRTRLRQADPQAHAAALANRPEEFEKALSAKNADWVYVRYIPSRDDVQRVHTAGKRLFIAGAAVVGIEDTNWRNAIDAGLDAILTDYPLELHRIAGPR